MKWGFESDFSKNTLEKQPDRPLLVVLLLITDRLLSRSLSLLLGPASTLGAVWWARYLPARGAQRLGMRSLLCYGHGNSTQHAISHGGILM